MGRSSQWFALRFVVATYAAGTAGCSLLIDVEGPQCTSSAQCIAADLGDRCVRNVCTSASACTGADCPPAMTPDAGGPAVCSSDGQCKQAGAPRCLRGTCVSTELAERWICEDEPEPSSSERIRFSFDVMEFVARAAPANLVASACRNNDPSCSEPLAVFTDSEGTGHVELELPNGFLGFIQVESDALTALSYITKPLRNDLQGRVLQVSAMSTVDLLSTIDGTVFDTTKGIALLEAFDCSGSPSGGVHFQESRGTAHPFYIVNHTPNSDVTSSVYDAENDVADGGFINVDPGFVTFSARLGVDGLMLGEFNAQVRPRAITFVDMYFGRNGEAR